jgi:hypothetical protein
MEKHVHLRAKARNERLLFHGAIDRMAANEINVRRLAARSRVEQVRRTKLRSAA